MFAEYTAIFQHRLLLQWPFSIDELGHVYSAALDVCKIYNSIPANKPPPATRLGIFHSPHFLTAYH